MRGRRSIAVAVPVVLASLAALATISVLGLLEACTSGTTPNCADAAEMCDPYEAGTDAGPGDAAHGG
jgi:hypothetical protein